MIELRWPDRWLNGKDDMDLMPPAEEDDWEGHANLACRVATGVNWVFTHKHLTLLSDLPFCGTGQSGGASQLAYTLTHYGLENLWDAVVLTGGPTQSDLAHACWGSCQSPAGGCYGTAQKCLADWAYGNPQDDCRDPEPDPEPYGPCLEDDFGSPAEVVFNEQSIAVSPNDEWDYLYPTTTLWFLFGDGDDTSAPWQQERYFDEMDPGTPIGGITGLPIPVANTTHNVPSTAEGAEAVLDALTESCVLP